MSEVVVQEKELPVGQNLINSDLTIRNKIAKTVDKKYKFNKADKKIKQTRDMIAKRKNDIINSNMDSSEKEKALQELNEFIQEGDRQLEYFNRSRAELDKEITEDILKECFRYRRVEMLTQLNDAIQTYTMNKQQDLLERILANKQQFDYVETLEPLDAFNVAVKMDGAKEFTYDYKKAYNKVMQILGNSKLQFRSPFGMLNSLTMAFDGDTKLAKCFLTNFFNYIINLDAVGLEQNQTFITFTIQSIIELKYCNDELYIKTLRKNADYLYARKLEMISHS